MSKKEEGLFKATTVEFKWNGKVYREHPSIVEAIKARPDYSEDAPKPKIKKAK